MSVHMAEYKSMHMVIHMSMPLYNSMHTLRKLIEMDAVGREEFEQSQAFDVHVAESSGAAAIV